MSTPVALQRRSMTSPTHDFVIVGGGSAGCCLAARLSEDPSCRVLVLEAGRPDPWWDLFIHMPAALTIPIGNPRYDWCYETEPEPFMGGRRVHHARGKVLGGSSSINGMIFIRGNPADFDRWATEPGMSTWSYAHCLPYFKRMENRVIGGPLRGTDGPLELEVGPCRNPLFQAFLDAVQQAGHPLTDDVNGPQQEGFGAFDRNIRRGRRLSAARAYLHPVLNRPNLDVVTRAHATGIRFEGRRATGVNYRVGRRDHFAAAGTVICSGGAFASPHLLQLSGIGDAQRLQALGISTVQHLPGVGQNLQDHLEVYVQHACSKPISEQPNLAWWRKPWLGYRWLFHRDGAAATNHFEAGGFVRSNEALDQPNLQFHFLPLAVRYDGTSPAGGHGYQVHVGPMLSDARGSVTPKSTDPFAAPAIRFNYLSTEQDRREWVEAIHTARQILRQPAFENLDGGELSPGPEVQTDDEILTWVARDAETALHPSCTCALGNGAETVVDPQTMKVHGTEGLAVVDASVMPTITNGNLYAPTMMIAEKAADLLRGNTPLDPQGS